MRTLRFINAVAFLLTAASAYSFELQDYRAVDLTHAYDSKTLYWPSKPPMQFEMQKLAAGVTPGGWYYAANRVCTPRARRDTSRCADSFP